MKCLCIKRTMGFLEFGIWIFLGIWLLKFEAFAAAPLKLDYLKVGTRTYSNVTVIGANATDLYFTHAHGISNIKLKYLDPSLQRRFNYDPALAAELEKQQEKDDTLYYQSLASNLVARAQKAATAAKKAAATSDFSLADPISEKSLLGKPAPPIEVEKWLGEKPALEGKFVLVCFWAPWSIPCRKCIPAMNALQKKFPEQLVVVGLTSEAQEDVETLDDPKLEFPSAIDSKARLSEAAGVNSIPFALLLDEKHIVRYVGHPGALDDKKLQALLVKLE